MLPMREAGNDDLAHVVQQRVEALGTRRRMLGESSAHVAGSNIGAHWSVADRLEVFGDEVDHRVSVLAKLPCVHAGRLRVP